MTEVNKVNAVNATQTTPKTTTDPVKKEKDAKVLLDQEIQRVLTTGDDRKKAQEKYEKEFVTFGKANGDKVADEKEAKKLANNYVKNEQAKENSRATTVYMDKEAYKAAEKARKDKRKELVDEYREQGLSKKEAKRKADAQLVENEYVRGKKTRAFIQDNKEKFYDENGNFSSDKFKQQAVKYANINTKEGEVENYHLSLKERRKAAEQEGTNANVIKNIAKKSNISYERDNTNLYRGLAVAGGTGLGIAAAPLFANSAAAVSAAAAAGSAAAGATGVITNGSASAGSSADAAASASAAARSSNNGIAAGAGIGLAFGTALASFIKDKGNVEDRVYAPGEKKPDPVPPKPQPEVTPEPPKPPIPQTCPLTPFDDTKTVQREANFCEHKIKAGDTPYLIVQAKYRHEDGTQLTHKEILQVAHELKMVHGCKNYRDALNMKVNDVFKCYEEFDGLAHPELKGQKFIVDCDAQTNGKLGTGPMKGNVVNFGGDYNKVVKEDKTNVYYFEDCNGNRSQNYDTKEERDAAMKKAEEAQKQSA